MGKQVSHSYPNLETAERINGIENGTPYSDFFITKNHAVKDGYQWCAWLEYSIGMYKGTVYTSWDGKIVSNNRYMINYVYKFDYD